METTLAKIEEYGIALAPAFGGVMVNGRLVTAKKFLAAKFGITLAKGSTVKTLKAAVGDDEAFKLARKEYDNGARDYYRASNLAGAALVADPNLRKALKVGVNKDGQPTGRYTISLAPVTRGASGGPTARETQLEKELNALRAEMAVFAAKSA